MQHAAPELVRRGRRRARMWSIKSVLGPARALDKRQWLRYLSVLGVAPLGVEDASKLPNLTAELLRRGMTESDVRKVLGENLLRVLAASEEAPK